MYTHTRIYTLQIDLCIYTYIYIYICILHTAIIHYISPLRSTRARRAQGEVKSFYTSFTGHVT